MFGWGSFLGVVATTLIDCVHLITWGPVIGSGDCMQQGAADQSSRVINTANEVSNPVK